jgi:hypothetical protein
MWKSGGWTPGSIVHGRPAVHNPPRRPEPVPGCPLRVVLERNRRSTRARTRCAPGPVRFPDIHRPYYCY